MKLVNIDDNDMPMNHPLPGIQYHDEYYTKPKVLFNLDMQMSEILSRKDLTDDEKLSLYTQILQKYLRIQNKKTLPVSSTTSLDPMHNTSVSSIKSRDSLQGIIQPSVRNFFESARESVPLDSLFQPTELFTQPLTSSVNESNTLRKNDVIRRTKRRKRPDLNDSVTLHSRREVRKRAIIEATSEPSTSNRYTNFYKWKPYKSRC